MSQKNNIYFMFGEPIFPPKDNSFEINFRDFKNLYTDSLQKLHQNINQQTKQNRELIIV